jgi:hypothetical protein
MLRPNDEYRSVEALQEAESREFVLVAADEAVGNDLLDSPHAEDRLAGVTNVIDPLPEALDALARRLSARTREFNNRGEFSKAHNAFLERRQKRHAAIEAKLEAAIRRGAIWQSIRLELERDFDTLLGNFGDLLDRMDAAAMKGRL